MVFPQVSWAGVLGLPEDLTWMAGALPGTTQEHKAGRVPRYKTAQKHNFASLFS
jgi:hypothetical protein